MTVEIQLWPCTTIMANGWYVLENMTWILTYWLITSGVGIWGVTVGIRAVVHGPCHRVCRLCGPQEALGTWTLRLG